MIANDPRARPEQPADDRRKDLSAPARIPQIVAAGACIGCGGCAVASAGGYAIGFNRLGLYQAQRTDAMLSPEEEARVAGICPFSDRAETEDEIAARVFPAAPHRHPAAGVWQSSYVGAVNEGAYRTRGSSGGMLTWMLAELLRRGVVDGVVHVVPHVPTAGDRRLFKYRVSRTVEEVNEGAKSRYYPIEFSAVLAQVRSEAGRYAFVGLPCFVKAVRLLARDDATLRSRLTVCVGLFCGHLKSAALVDSFARQIGVDPGAVAAVDFRLKQPGRRADVYTLGLTLQDGSVRARDWSRMVDGDWGMGFFQYSACNACDDVMAETADIAFGDAWVPPFSADGRGTNVVVVRSGALDEVVREAWRDGRLELAEVDGDFLARTQAAGLRHRREGLAYRLYRARGSWTPRKRVQPGIDGVGWKRRRIYDLRRGISRWSHVVFANAEALGMAWAYRGWARTVARIYRVILWMERGPVLNRVFRKLAGRAGRG